MVRISRSAEDTRAIGEGVASCLRAGDVVALSGDLGAGKTCLVQGAARALGVTGRVTSPSFVLLREYQGSAMPVLHLDVYRLEQLQELIDLGYEEFLDPRWVVFIEWGDAVAPLLPEERLEIEITHAAEEDRRITLRAGGPAWERRLAAVAERTAAWEEPAEGTGEA